MVRENKRSDLDKATGDAGGKIEQQKASRTEDFLDTPTEEEKAQTVSKHVPGHRAEMEELEGEQLPNLPMAQPLAGQAEILHEVDAAVMQENALNNEGDDQHHDENRGDTWRVIRIPHVLTIRHCHGCASLKNRRPGIKQKSLVRAKELGSFTQIPES